MAMDFTILPGDADLVTQPRSAGEQHLVEWSSDSRGLTQNKHRTIAHVHAPCWVLGTGLSVLTLGNPLPAALCS